MPTTSRAYERTFEMPAGGVSVTVHENANGTIFIHFENEHAEYGVTASPQESAELRATLHTAESRIKHVGPMEHIIRVTQHDHEPKNGEGRDDLRLLLSRGDWSVPWVRREVTALFEEIDRLRELALTATAFLEQSEDEQMVEIARDLHAKIEAGPQEEEGGAGGD